MSKTESYILQIIRHNRNYGLLFVSCVCFILIYPSIADTSISDDILIAFSTITVGAGLAAVSRHHRVARITQGFGILALLIYAFKFFTPGDFEGNDYKSFLTLGTMALFWLFNSLTIFLAVLKPAPVTLDRILGAISVYVLIGLTFFVLYLVIYLIDNQAFLITTIDGKMGVNNMFFFSFVTLTTLGYGNVVPQHPIAQSLAILQCVIGVMYIAILMASLVSSYKFPFLKDETSQM